MVVRGRNGEGEWGVEEKGNGSEQGEGEVHLYGGSQLSRNTRSWGLCALPEYTFKRAPKKSARIPKDPEAAERSPQDPAGLPRTALAHGPPRTCQDPLETQGMMMVDDIFLYFGALTGCLPQSLIRATLPWARMTTNYL